MAAMAGLSDAHEVALANDLERAFPRDLGVAPDGEAKLRLLRELHRHYLTTFTPPEQILTMQDAGVDLDGMPGPVRIAAIEEAWNRYEETRALAAAGPLPTTPPEFDDWFFSYAVDHVHEDLCEHLRERATLVDMAMFVLAEEKVDGRFDDMIALAQLGASGVTKMTIAHNYWDEMGNGDPAYVHTTMFDRSAVWLRRTVVEPLGVDLRVLEFAEVYANACELLMYGLRRRWLLRMLASIGLLEQTSSPRFLAMVDGCRRLGVPDDVVQYQQVHVGVDAEHGREWFDGVFTPVVRANPAVIPELALGVVIRGNVAGEYYAQVQRRLFGLG